MCGLLIFSQTDDNDSNYYFDNNDNDNDSNLYIRPPTSQFIGLQKGYHVKEK